MWRKIVTRLSSRFSLPALAQHTARPQTLLLFYNRMWNQRLELPGIELPQGCVITEDRRQMHAADAVVFHIPSLRWLPHRHKRPGQLWVAWSMECEENYPCLRDSAYMRHFDLTMTYRLDADVSMPYLWYYISGPNLVRAMCEPPPPKSQDKLAVLFISSRMNRSRRLEYATELMRYVDVHSYGKFRRNRTLSDDNWRPTKLEVLAAYKFTLAFENAIGEDYVTEKFFDPLVAGSVPVYLGAPNVERLTPGDHCYINTADFANPKALGEYLLALHEDTTAYEAYFAWKQRPLRPAFLQFLAGQKEHPFVRLCHRARTV